MNMIPDLKYSKDHEWVRVEKDIAYLGITNYAQLQLGDIVYVEMPVVDDEITKDEVICAIESVKTAADVLSPVSGLIFEANEALDEAPELVNEEPYESWIVAVKLSNIAELDELMDEGDYAKFCEEEE
jgi:glycine cleavage system H protein